MALTPKQATFVQEYLIDLNGTQAAIRAGYSAATAQAIATENLSKPLVKAAIDDAMSARAERTEISQDKVLLEFAKVGFTDLTSVISWGSREVMIGFDSEGHKLPHDQLTDAVLVEREFMPYVDAIPSDQLSDIARAAVAEVSLTKDGLKVKMHDKVAALTQIGRHLGMFKDNSTVTGRFTVEQTTRHVLDPRNLDDDQRDVLRGILQTRLESAKEKP